MMPPIFWIIDFQNFLYLLFSLYCYLLDHFLIPLRWKIMVNKLKNHIFQCHRLGIKDTFYVMLRRLVCLAGLCRQSKYGSDCCILTVIMILDNCVSNICSYTSSNFQAFYDLEIIFIHIISLLLYQSMYYILA
jgi:hypothetical protein